ncbi:MAG TPA: ATP-binding protein [Solirubrobacteraceae bacterium]
MTATRSYRVPAGKAAASAARTLVSGALAAEVEQPLLDDVRLLVSELVTNSVLHAGVEEGGELTLEVGVDDVLRVSVSDEGAGFAPDAAESEDIGGWGLLLVERLADRWGIVHDDATHVWFEIDRRSPRAAAA